MKHLLWKCAAGFILGAMTVPLSAQATARNVTPTSSQQAGVTKLVTTTLLAQLTGDIADAGLRDTAVPWVINVPKDSGALRWSHVATSIRRALQARDRGPSDRKYSVISVHSYQFTRDSLVVDYFIGTQWACGSKFTGGGTGYRAAMAWQLDSRPWVPVPSKEMEYSDSGPCQDR